MLLELYKQWRCKRHNDGIIQSEKWAVQMIVFLWYSEIKSGDWFGRVGQEDSCFCFLIVLCFSKQELTKNGLCQEWGGISKLQNGCKASLENHSKCHIWRTAFPHTIHSTRDFQIWKGADSVSHLSRNTGPWRKQRGFCFWAEKMNLFYPAKQTLAVY